jgi:hypothetical protein
VKYASGQPLIIYDDYAGEQHVYKMINLLGDGNRAVEYYPDNRPSVIDNASAKIERELTDAEIVELYGGELIANVIKEKPLLEDIEKIEDAKEHTLAVMDYVDAKKVSKGVLKIDGQHYFLDSNNWGTTQKNWGHDLFIYPDGRNNPDSEEIYIASSYTGSPEFFSEGKANFKSKTTVESYDTLNEFTEEEKASKLTNFAEKYKMTEDQALAYINEALVKNRQGVIDKLKECF